MLNNAKLTANSLIIKTRTYCETKAYAAQLKVKSKSGRVSMHFIVIEIEKQIASIINSLDAIELSQIKQFIPKQIWKSINEIVANYNHRNESYLLN